MILFLVERQAWAEDLFDELITVLMMGTMVVFANLVQSGLSELERIPPFEAVVVLH